MKVFCLLVLCSFPAFFLCNASLSAVQSARVGVFLLDEKGKLVGQKSEWVISGTKEKPGLAPETTANFNVVVPTDKPFKKTKVLFTRIKDTSELDG